MCKEFPHRLPRTNDWQDSLDYFEMAVGFGFMVNNCFTTFVIEVVIRNSSADGYTRPRTTSMLGNVPYTDHTNEDKQELTVVE